MTGRCSLKVLKIRPEIIEMTNEAADYIFYEVQYDCQRKKMYQCGRVNTNQKLQIDLPVLKLKEFLQRTNEKEMHRSKNSCAELWSPYNVREKIPQRVNGKKLRQRVF